MQASRTLTPNFPLGLLFDLFGACFVFRGRGLCSPTVVRDDFELRSSCSYLPRAGTTDTNSNFVRTVQSLMASHASLWWARVNLSPASSLVSLHPPLTMPLASNPMVKIFSPYCHRFPISEQNPESSQWPWVSCKESLSSPTALPIAYSTELCPSHNAPRHLTSSVAQHLLSPLPRKLFPPPSGVCQMLASWWDHPGLLCV